MEKKKHKKQLSLYKIFIAVVGSFFAAVFCSGMNFVLSLVIWGIRKLLHR